MTASAGDGEVRGLAAKFGVQSGHSVQEIGYDDDCVDALRGAIGAASGSELQYDIDDVVDVVLLWWREDDGDLVDALVDAIGPLTDNGVVWLLTPKPGRDGHVEPSDIADAGRTAGLAPTSTINAAPEWQGTRLVAPKSARR